MLQQFTPEQEAEIGRQVAAQVAALTPQQSQQQTQQFTPTPGEKAEVTRRVAELEHSLTRHREFAVWLKRGQRAQLEAGRNVAWIREFLPPPHALDEYEWKRAIEEGLA